VMSTKDVVGRISVFAGGFDLAAAENICSAEGIVSDEVLDILTGLVRPISDRSGSSRHPCPIPTTRNAAPLRTPSTRQTRPRNDVPAPTRDYYHGLAAQAASDWFSPREAQWL